MPSLWALERAKRLRIDAFLFLKEKARIVHCLCDGPPMTGNTTCELHWQIANLLDDSVQDLQSRIARIEPFGPNTHAGVWISKETGDKISKDGA